MDNDTASESNKPVNVEKSKKSAKISDDELILRRKRLQNAVRVRAYREKKKVLDHTMSQTTEKMEEAVNVVRSGAFTITEVALRYNIPRSTLTDRVKHGRKQITGKPLALSGEIEKKLADNLKYMERHGFKSTIKEKLELIGAYVKSCEIPSRFKGECPGGGWFALFSERNGLPKPSPENEFAAVKEYFAVLKDTIEEHDLNDAGKIWFIDETGFNFNQGKITRNSDKERDATVLTACNAAGQKAPIFIVLRDNSRSSDFVSNDEVCYAFTDGCLSKSEFRGYFTSTFLRYLRNPPPILIAYNGRSAQIDIQLIEESRGANIIFIKIPRLLKEYSIFDSLKYKWETSLNNLKSDDFEKQFCDMIVNEFKNLTADDIKESFRKAGIYPFDGNITEERYGAEFVQKWAKNELSLTEKADVNVALDFPAVNVYDVQFVKEEPEELMVPGYEEDYVKDEITNQDHFAENSPSSSSMPAVQASTQTPATLKHQTPVSETLLIPKIWKDQPRPRSREPAYAAIIEAARTIQQPCTVCSVFGCRNSVRLNPDKGFFQIPTQPARFLNWLKLINRGDLVDKLGAGDADHWVCSDHFDDADFDGEALTDEATPHLKLPTKTSHVEYVHCGDEIAEIKLEPLDESEAMEVEIHFEPEIPPTVTYNTAVMTQAQNERQNTSVPATHTNLNIFHLKHATSVINPIDIENNEIPAFKIDKIQNSEEDYEPNQIENVAIPAININENLSTKPARTDLKAKKNYLKNATISSIEHVTLPIEVVVEKKSVVVQTTKDLEDNIVAPLKKKYAQELQEAQEKLRLKEESPKSVTMDRKKFIESCGKYLDEKIANIVKSHASLFEKSKGNRYSQNFKMFALNLYLCSPQSYKFVEQFFCLPSMTTIHRFQTPIRTGFNENLMHSFRIKVNQMSDKEKMCTVCFDYMDVNKNLYYDVRNDFICGLHEIDQKQGTEAAKYAPVIMVRGMYSKWKQPVSFALASEKKCYPELKLWLLKTIALLFEIGLNVKAFVANQETEFLDFSDISVTESFFEVLGRKIYQIFDVPILFKNARDDFLKYEFHFRNKVAKLSHVLEVYDADQQQELRLMPKITDQHFRPAEDSENDVKLSIELFSRAVAAALNFHVITNMVDKKLNDTVKFIQLMNNLFDILNSTKLTSEYEYKKAYKGTTEQNQFLKTALEYLQQLQMVDEAGNVIEKRTFVTGLLITIKSLVSLMEDLQKENYKYILTKNLSKDCMVGYFQRVRELAGTAHARPTPVMFSRSFKRLFLTNLVNNAKKGGTEVDLKSTLAKISDYVNLNVDWKKEDEENNRTLGVGVQDYQKLWPAPSNDFITGYLLWKCLEKHACQPLVETFCRQYDMEVNIEALLNKFKEYNGNNMKKKGLLPLPFYFTHFVDRLDRVFQEHASTPGVNMFGFGSYIYAIMVSETVHKPCECFPVKFMKYLFIRIKIFHMVKDYNVKNKPTRHSRVKK